MSVIDRLSSSLGRRDEVPNKELAAELSETRDKAAIAELVRNLQNKEKKVQSDCIKVLYEIGEQAPDLISDYCQDFGALLGQKNNRLVWGGMTALNTIVFENPEGVYDLLPAMMEAIESGSVITRDNGIEVLAKLSSVNEIHGGITFAILIDQLEECPIKQLPQYAEKALVAVRPQNGIEFREVLKRRYGDLEKDSRRKRIDRVLKHVESLIN